jgi:hypothetical protein
MATGKAVEEKPWYEKVPQRDAANAVAESIAMLAVPMPVFRVLSDAAAKRNMTTAELLNKAVEVYLRDTDPDKETD